jgi:hypothetical protein
LNWIVLQSEHRREHGHHNHHEHIVVKGPQMGFIVFICKFGSTQEFVSLKLTLPLGRSTCSFKVQ